jgi:hypothetical protein
LDETADYKMAKGRQLDTSQQHPTIYFVSDSKAPHGKHSRWPENGLRKRAFSPVHHGTSLCLNDRDRHSLPLDHSSAYLKNSAKKNPGYVLARIARCEFCFYNAKRQ